MINQVVVDKRLVLDNKGVFIYIGDNGRLAFFGSAYSLSKIHSEKMSNFELLTPLDVIETTEHIRFSSFFDREMAFLRLLNGSVIFEMV